MSTDLNLRPLPDLEPARIDPSAAQDQLKRLIDTVSAYRVGIWEYDFATKQTTAVNDLAGILMLDHIGIEYRGVDDLADYVHPDDRARRLMALESLSATSTARFRLAGPLGTIWVRDSYCLHRNPDGTPAMLVCHTKREEIEDDKYSGLFKMMCNMPVFIMVWDRDFTFLDVICSDKVQMFHQREELLGANGYEVYKGKLGEMLGSNLLEALETGEMRNVEYRTDMFGKTYYWQTSMVPVDEVVYGVTYEITGRIKRMEELLDARRKAEESDELKSAFLANMSHEVRSPLNAIVGFSDILADEDDRAVRESYNDIIHSNSELLMRLVGDVLDLSRIDSGKSEMKFERVGINSLLSDIEMAQSLKMPEGVELRVNYLPEETEINTDRGRVSQVLYNFLSNSAKNTHSGSITISAEECGNSLRLSVTDTGCGIPADKLGTIFNRFVKVNENAQGSGLGLAICQSLVGRMGGQVGVESALGSGSTFHFTLPYRYTPEEQSTQADKGGKRQVLVAEESDAAYAVIKMALHCDFELLRVRDGEKALAAFISQRPDIVLLSTRLPVMNGIETAKRIRTVSKTVPMVAMTGSDFYIEQRWALENGCNDVISKPYSPKEMREVVDALI